jgi:hypothetical protein
MASATLSIGGSIIHYLIGLSIDQNVDFQNLKKTIEDWSNFHFLIVDEISNCQHWVVPCWQKYISNYKNEKLKSSSLQPFGG